MCMDKTLGLRLAEEILGRESIFWRWFLLGLVWQWEDLAFDVCQLQHVLYNDSSQLLSWARWLRKQFKLMDDPLHLLHSVHVSLGRRHQRSTVVRLLTLIIQPLTLTALLPLSEWWTSICTSVAVSLIKTSQYSNSIWYSIFPWTTTEHPHSTTGHSTHTYYVLHTWRREKFSMSLGLCCEEMVLLLKLFPPLSPYFGSLPWYQ